MSLTEKFDFDSLDLANRLSELVNNHKPKIAVVGDYCLDKYLYIYPQLNEISVETKNIAFQARAKRVFAGAGGTIVSNLQALGADAYCFGVIGNDGESFDLLHALKNTGANVEGMILSDRIITATYIKPMRAETQKIGEPLQSPANGVWTESNRIDIRNPVPIPQQLIERLKERILSRISEFDAVIVSEQFPPGSEATFSQDFRRFISQTAQAYPNIPFLCDSRFFINDYRNVLIKCNANELFDAYHVAQGNIQRRETTLDENSENKEIELVEAGGWLVKQNECPALITRGKQGAILLELVSNRKVKATFIPAIHVEPPIDICGAGDATNAGFAFSKVLGFTLAESAYLAGIVSAITIKQIGVTGVASVRQMVDLLRNKKS